MIQLVSAGVLTAALALSIVLAWAVTFRFSRRYAVPVAVSVTAVFVAAATPLQSAATIGLPSPTLVAPVFTFDALIGIALPLFNVSIASQGIPGLAVLSANGYRPNVGAIFTVTGLSSLVVAFFGAVTLSLAAITAALSAGPEAHADPARRWVATVAAGFTYAFPFFGVSSAFWGLVAGGTKMLLLRTRQS